MSFNYARPKKVHRRRRGSRGTAEIERFVALAPAKRRVYCGAMRCLIISSFGKRPSDSSCLLLLRHSSKKKPKVPIKEILSDACEVHAGPFAALCARPRGSTQHHLAWIKIDRNLNCP
jgi:hypothetical protein